MDEKQLDSLVGQKFEDLSKEEMNFILSAATVASAASSFVGSYTLSAFTKCR